MRSLLDMRGSSKQRRGLTGLPSPLGEGCNQVLDGGLQDGISTDAANPGLMVNST
jgi:hypothetical protein